MSKCRVVTVISDVYHPGFIGLLRKSCHYFDIDLHVLTAGKSYDNHNIKDQLLKEYLKQLNEDDYVIFIDGYDSFFIAPLDELMAKFSMINKEAVFSVEMTCWPDPSLAAAYGAAGCATDSPYRYLNSGGFMGTCGILREMLTVSVNASADFQTSNQYMWTLRSFRFMDRIHLDTDCELFLCTGPNLTSLQDPGPVNQRMWSVDFHDPLFLKNGMTCVKEQIARRQDRIECLSTESFPMHIHFNGSIGDYMIKNQLLNEYLPWL